LWQNISFGLAMNQNGNCLTTANKEYVKRTYRGIPDELWSEIVKWAAQTNNTGGNIKKANLPFAPLFNTLPVEYKKRISDHCYEESVRLFEATHSTGIAESVWEFL